MLKQRAGHYEVHRVLGSGCTKQESEALLVAFVEDLLEGQDTKVTDIAKKQGQLPGVLLLTEARNFLPKCVR